MSRFNSSECENKSYNSINSEKIFNLSDIIIKPKLSKMPELINSNRKVITNNSFVENYKMQSNSMYGIHSSDMDKLSVSVDNKKRGNKISDEESITLIFNTKDKDKEVTIDNQSLSDLQISNDRNESIPLVNILKHKNVNAINAKKLVGQYQEPFPPNKAPLLNRKLMGDNQETSNPLITTAYNFNGYHPTEIKTTNSSGSSFINNKQSYAVFSTQNSQHMINNDYYSMPTKSQYLYYTTQRMDDFVDQCADDEFTLSSGNTKLNNLLTDSNKIDDCAKIPMVNNSKILIPSYSVNRKEAVLVQQPECYEREIYHDPINGCCEESANRLTGTSETEIKSGVLRENSIPVDYVYQNNCYGVPFVMNDIRKNISYSTQQTPIQLFPFPGSVLLNSINPNFPNMNLYPHYCLTPNFVVQPNEKSKTSGSIFTEQKVKNPLLMDNPDSFISKPEILEESPLLYNSEPMKSEQSLTQFSSNNELNRINSYPILPSNESITSSNVIVGDEANFHTFSQPNLTINDSNKINDPISINKSSPSEKISTDRVKKIGKFMISPVSPTDEPSIKLTDNSENLLNYNPTNPTEVSDDIPKLDCPPSHSRFKKTRIKETIERWCMNGLNTYDCRVKTIPPKIANLYNSKPEYVSKEMGVSQNCEKCDTHDKEKYCQDNNYHMKEFKFWHNGNHMNLCSELENDDKNICQFHAKILKLLNQNQNLSLSKYSNNSIDLTENTNLSSQMYQTVLISSPERENFIINIDSQAPHVLYSAPPVSPSIMNTASVSSFPTNIQSPRSATMVMLKRTTPVMLSNATRNTPLLSESISIEKINRTSNTVIESDNNSLYGHQIRTNDNNSLIDLWQSSPLKSDQLTFKLSSPTYVAGTVIADNSNIEDEMYGHQQSVYSIGPVSPYYYPCYHQSLPSISTTMTTNKCHDYNTYLSNLDEVTQVTDLPKDVVEEISKCTNSFKLQMTNIFQSEYNKLLFEIKTLRKTNEELINELTNMKQRSDKLENLLKQKNESLIKFQSNETVDHVPQSNNSLQCSRSYQPSDFDYNNLI